VPVQLVAADANTSAGQTPEEPVHVSATSHGPAAPRHVNVPGWKTSTQVLAVPLQWSAASHAPPVEVPVQLVAADANTSAGQVPDAPVHVSATSHGPAAPRHSNVPGWKTSTQVFAVPLQ
jgi:hypothetical protein